MTKPEGDNRRERLFGSKGIISIVSANKSTRPVEGRDLADLKSLTYKYKFGEDLRGTSFADFESVEIYQEMTVTGIKRPEPLTVIERLRAQYPDENILAVGIELDNPEEMRDFFFQYAEELRTSPHSLESVKQHPLDAAAGQIKRRANYSDREVVSRWQELFATGTLKTPPDHSLDWIKPHSKPQTGEEVQSDSLGDVVDHSLDWLTAEKAMRAQLEAELRKVRAQNARLESVPVFTRKRAEGEGLVEAKKRMIKRGWMDQTPQFLKPRSHTANSTLGK